MSNKGSGGGGYRKKKAAVTSGHTKVNKSSGLKRASKKKKAY